MDPVTVLAEVRRALEDVKAKGTPAVGVDAMLEYLASVEERARQADLSRPEFRDRLALAKLQGDADNWRAQYQIRVQEQTEFNRFAIQAGQSAIRSAMLVNGGGAVALLAFIGNAWRTGMANDTVSRVADALALFAFGVLSAALASGIVYLVQRAFLEAFDVAAEEHGASAPRHGRDWNRIGLRLNVVAIAIVIASFFLFGIGVYTAYGGLKSL